MVGGVFMVVVGGVNEGKLRGLSTLCNMIPKYFFLLRNPFKGLLWWNLINFWIWLHYGV